MDKDLQLNIDLTPEVANGKYANLAIVTHSNAEFVLDFASVMPGFPKPVVQSRVIMTPEHAKRLLLALQDNISKYENNNGIIVITPSKQPPQQGGGTFHMGGGGGAKS